MTGDPGTGTLPGTGTVPGTESVPGPSTEGSVLLDIGGDRGALVVFTPAALDGAEIEIRPMGRDWDGTHTAVRRRELPAAEYFAGVFGSLLAGPYQLRLRGEVSDIFIELNVTGGEITEARWPAT